MASYMRTNRTRGYGTGEVSQATRARLVMSCAVKRAPSVAAVARELDTFRSGRVHTEMRIFVKGPLWYSEAVLHVPPRGILLA